METNETTQINFRKCRGKRDVVTIDPEKATITFSNGYKISLDKLSEIVTEVPFSIMGMAISDLLVSNMTLQSQMVLRKLGKKIDFSESTLDSHELWNVRQAINFLIEVEQAH